MVIVLNISFKTVQKIYDRLGDSTSKKIFSSMLMFNATKDVFWLDEMEELWKSGVWNQEKIEALANAHYRTPYHYAK